MGCERLQKDPLTDGDKDAGGERRGHSLGTCTVGRHAMVLLGMRAEGNKTFFLFQFELNRARVTESLLDRADGPDAKPNGL